MRSVALPLLVACFLCPPCEAIDMKWTPNGEGPAPFSTKARQQMGMDPGAFAGQTAVAPKSGMLGFSLGMLLSIYLANNWKVVMAVQALVQSLIAPLISSVNSRRAAAASASERLQLESARKARLERLKATQGKED
ncbi:hypothetical protein AB1Y20_003659 [Prymnesium parvum]|uniref:ER membrane protein complex subunit 4 n=1 Tax=Prymnesium parvum TaxID=97485 RepID=A0AB34J784_PRYPA